jgi:hypothetical protein
MNNEQPIDPDEPLAKLAANGSFAPRFGFESDRMNAADRSYKRAFLDRNIRPGDRVTVAEFGSGTLRRIGGNYAEIAFDADNPEARRRASSRARASELSCSRTSSQRGPAASSPRARPSRSISARAVSQLTSAKVRLDLVATPSAWNEQPRKSMRTGPPVAASPSTSSLRP